jgi:hypothetical protein
MPSPKATPRSGLVLISANSPSSLRGRFHNERYVVLAGQYRGGSDGAEVARIEGDVLLGCFHRPEAIFASGHTSQDRGAVAAGDQALVRKRESHVVRKGRSVVREKDMRVRRERSILVLRMNRDRGRCRRENDLTRFKLRIGGNRRERKAVGWRYNPYRERVVATEHDRHCAGGV